MTAHRTPSDSTRKRVRHLECPHCHKVLEFIGDAPSFCGYCGHSIHDALLASTVEQGTVDLSADSAVRAAAQSQPSEIAGYRLLRQLGRGGMGTVFEGESNDGRKVAVKLLSNLDDASDIALERFRQEGRLASMIAHPHCVFVVAADEDAGRPYIIMELMSGQTLKDLVAAQGPLEAGAAIEKILDVIDGLREAHRLGVIHRDVKPTNCFLLPDGRVKVGDFGLSRSLHSDLSLTNTGAFLGTPLFASPEQIKCERIDYRSDVYSVAATLYYLLTGKAPFQDGTGGMAAVLARIVSEPAPPLRAVRPDLSPALEKVILRGLERDRDKRWRSLDDFQAALRAFLPDNLSIGGLGMRLGAYLLDWLLWAPVPLLASALLFHTAPWLVGAALLAPLYVYFWLMDGRWGGSLGKRWLRLRVWTEHGTDPPGLSRGLTRTLTHAVLVGLPVALVLLGNSVLVSAVPLAVGLVMLLAPMRAANGYRALHDILSGTRVIQLPWPEQRHELRPKQPRERVRSPRPDGVPETVGPFRVLDTIRWTPEEGILVAEDPSLGRRIGLLLRPANAPPLDAQRRDLARPTRLRWLSSGLHGEQQWDAFVAPAGCTLPELVDDSRLDWHDTRNILARLADELAAAGTDGTLPGELTVDQVWVEPSGRVYLLDFALDQQGLMQHLSDTADAQERGLSLLRQVAVLALEGKPRPTGDDGAIRAPLPGHAAAILDRLLGVRQPYRTVAELRADLEASRNEPTRLTSALRAGYLGNLALLFLPGVLMMFLASEYGNSAVYYLPESFKHVATVQREVEKGTKKAQELGEDLSLEPLFYAATVGGSITLWPALWVLWAFIWRGGWTLRSLGLRLVRGDGRRAGRLRCAWRTFVVWAPIAFLLLCAAWLQANVPDAAWLHWLVQAAAATLLFSYLALTLILPARPLYDRLAGTYLVPR